MVSLNEEALTSAFDVDVFARIGKRVDSSLLLKDDAMLREVCSKIEVLL